jgi:hypothetical protein
MTTDNTTPRKKPDTQRVINRDANATQRAVQAVQLRVQKLTFAEIATRCGYASAGAARKAILREMQRVVVANVEELRREELAILDRLHSECWELAMNKKNTARLFAVDRLLMIAERRSRLMGLDAPTNAGFVPILPVIREVPLGYLGTAQAQ